MRDVFISYVEEDAPIVLKIAAGFEAAGFSTWYYLRDSLPGIPYLTQILQALDQCQAVVLVVSEKALGSSQVDKEVIRAHEAGKHFIPLLVGLTHEEYQRRRPEWAMMTGAAVSLPIQLRRISQIMPRLIESLGRLGVLPQKAHTTQAVHEPIRIAPTLVEQSIPLPSHDQTRPIRSTPVKKPLSIGLVILGVIAVAVAGIFVVRGLLDDDDQSANAQGGQTDTEERTVATATEVPATFSPTPSPASAMTSVPRTKQTVIASDDFADSGRGLFPQRSNDNSEYSIGYVDGEYLIFNVEDDEKRNIVGIWTSEDYSDLLISVEARIVGKDEGTFVGVRCRYDPEQQSGYEFGLDREGQFWLDRLDQGERVILWDFAQLPVFNGADQTNHIDFQCSGTNLTAWVNDVQVLSVDDLTYQTGTIALTSALYTSAPAGRADVRFDNLVLWQP